ncbi:MAG: cytochrome c biogenesis CcdA family protein [Candidatus Gastranaerophilales bacterium]|nr:cytochrome c biogenesis CcdA family protein [Candidatus Gastranaerophilales bacterium]
MIDITTYFTEQTANWNFQAILIGLSFMGGIFASISPCSLAMLPVVIGYIGGYGDGDNFKTFLQLVSFIFGSSIVFSIIGVICALTGHVFISLAGGYFIIIMASVILAMGLNLLGILDFNIPTIINKVPSNPNNSKYIYPMILGAVFALGGTPCSTPILAGIMSFAAISNSVLLSIIMLFAFALGQGLILVIAGMFTSVVKQFGTVVSFSGVLLKICGSILVLAALYLYYKSFAPFFV